MFSTKLFLVYTATGDFYEKYELKVIFNDKHRAIRFADEAHVKLKSDDDLDGYDGLLVFVREAESDKLLSSLFSDWGNVPEEWFVRREGSQTT